MRWRAVAATVSLFWQLAAADSNLTSPQSSQQVLTGDFKPPQVFENENVVRNTNLEKGYVRETVNVVVKNVDKSPQSDYYLPFEYDVMGKVGGLDVRDKKHAEKGAFEVTTAAMTAVLDADGTSSKPTQYYLIHFPDPLKPKDSITLSISYHYLDSLVPLPATIKQDEKQYLTYTFSAYLPTAYRTLKQKTKLKFASADIPDYTTTTGLTSSADPEVQGSIFTYGPYDTSKIPAGITHPVTVRYEFTKPILTCTSLERDIELSHWGGNLATEERYTLHNNGATLSEPFSRVTWATQTFYGAGSPSSALKELKYPLRPGSVDPYFTDDIGNVSTSRYRPTPPQQPKKEANLELKPRYPIFGGWKYKFRVGWNNDLSSVLRQLKSPSSTTYTLTVPFLEGPRQPEGIQYTHVTLRIVLPEGATGIRHQLVPSPSSGLPILSSSLSTHASFLDTLGRPALEFTALNVVDEAREALVVVTYEYGLLAALRKPVAVFGGVLALFGLAWVVGTLDVRIGKGRKVA